MTNFKVGDKVLCTCNLYGVNLTLGTIVDTCVFDKDYWKVDIEGLESRSNLAFYGNEMVKVAVDNKLNRKLYPNYVEKDGYLVPKEVKYE